MAQFRKRVTEIKKHLHERLDNDAKAFRFDQEEVDIINKKVKYIAKHLSSLQEQEKHREQVECYGYLAVAYMKLNRYDMAKTALTTQLDMAFEYKHEHMQRMAYGNLGVIYKQEWKLANAMECYEASLNLALKHNNKYAQGRLYNNMANILELQMDYEQAIEYHQKHLDVAIALNDRDGIVKSCGALASLHHTLEDLANSVSFLEKLMDQLRKNLKVLDTLADDVSDSDEGGYINIEEGEDGSDEDDGDGGGGGGAKLGIFGKLKKKITG